MKRIFLYFLNLTIFWGLCLTISPVSAVLAQGQAGTTLTAEKTAEVFDEITNTYDWSVEKLVDPTSLTVNGADCETVTYTINVTRSLVSSVEKIGVRGQVCVTNGGAATTEDLTIFDHPQCKIDGNQFADIGPTQTITPAQLAPGESKCYDYEVEFAPCGEGYVYRNAAHVTITNHSGHLGQEFGPEPKADFSLPSEPTIINKDAEADVSEEETCPAGFTCTPMDTGDGIGPWHFTDSGSVSFDKEVCNSSALCDNHFNLPNTVTLTENDSKEESTASANVDIYSGVCPTGCTLTIGYWKTHAGFTGNNADRVTQFLPILLGTQGGQKTVTVSTAAQAVTILTMRGEAPHGLHKLYAQLLGTKLNIA